MFNLNPSFSSTNINYPNTRSVSQKSGNNANQLTEQITELYEKMANAHGTPEYNTLKEKLDNLQDKLNRHLRRPKNPQ